MYSSKPSYVLGFHGTHEELGRDILNGKQAFRHSNNAYDWLGQGIYFWENNPERAQQWAEQTCQRKQNNPFVLGAIIDLGICLDLLDQQWLDFIHVAYNQMIIGLTEANRELPTNLPFGSNDFDFKKRELDCAVIRFAIALAKIEKNITFDSVRAAFWEGEELYPQAGFRKHNHIQLAIINPNCIKGIFLPRKKAV